MVAFETPLDVRFFDQDPNGSTPEERLIVGLRAEAEAVKDCYTSFFFQSLAIALASLTFVFTFFERAPYITGTLVLTIGILLSTVRIGLHKYETANRLYGYELYLSRRKRLFYSKLMDSRQLKKFAASREESFYAWRIVQPKFYHALYSRKIWWPTLLVYKFKFRPNVLDRVLNWIIGGTKRGEIVDNAGKQIAWLDKARGIERDVGVFEGFDRERDENGHLSREARRMLLENIRKTNKLNLHHAGGWLQKTGMILHTFCLVCWMPLLLTVFEINATNPSEMPAAIWGSLSVSQTGASAIFLALAIFLLLFIVYRNVRARYKRKILENGLLSINYCAIMWHIVNLCHVKAIMALEKKPTEHDGPLLGQYFLYTHYLSKFGDEALENIETIYDWINAAYAEISSSGVADGNATDQTHSD